ncbi:kynurenine 3-monooxygenase, mitochondrial precursor [Naganishia adeliensis]|uniref:Kynurenine 3-monooxygenase, mitochondrial n=1 Tax=Naganishia adeliensis TaxID=92952 RepID=A0ACC2WH78_9TREE|nr:kynurenine 3-monooxygenase, mitochondrial precursor [Naganishia adeliensis]
MPENSTKKVLIVGAGPVGSLTALTFHKRGWQVEIWEGREDPRGTDMTPANLRSINLAISSRGLEALRSVDPSLADGLLGQAIPMKGRMIHHNDGRQESQLYDPAGGQCINSLPRPLLNLRLIQALPTDSDRMKLRFETKLDRIDWRRNIAYARPKKGGKPGEELAQGTNQEEKEGKQDSDSVEFDLVIGCDGSWSKVRQEMMKVERIDFSQSFIQHAYIELHMPPNEVKENNDNDAKFKIDQHHLHIWPRHSFMLIGLPNQDGSFTLTLFAPFTSIEHLKTREQAEEFFQEHFPTALEWVGKDRLIEDFMKNPRGKLVTINASPSHHDSKALLLGDSSHSMVPFYGQGLNCGLEDVRVLGCMLEKNNVSSVKSSGGLDADAALGQALSEYSEIRGKDLEAICELAMEN